MSEPPGAAVFLEQRQRLGQTPLTLHQPGGTRFALTLVKDDYLPRQITAVFDSGRTAKLEVTLTPKQSELIVGSTPFVGAEILVDGQPQGRTPNRFSVDAGVEHLVDVRKAGFESYQEKVKLRPGERRQVTAVLLREGRHAAMGVLVLRVNAADAIVYIDGKPLGKTPLPPVPLAARAHELRIKGPAGAEARKRVMLKRGERLEVDVQLTPKKKGR